MLSTNQPSGIQRRRAQHRRQISTPAAFEASTVRPLPANPPQRRLRNNMSLDLRDLNLENIQAQQANQGDGTVSNTNIGQPSQHHMQVAQPHSMPQPGPQDTLLRSPVQLPMSSPQTPRRVINLPPSMAPLSPSKPPTEQQLKELHAHIQSVYGASGQVFINILPTPTPTPQKPMHLASHDALNMVSQAPNFDSMANINLGPTSSAMTFDFENPDIDMGYESSSYYTSDALSPSPISSPHQKSMHSFLEGIGENQEMSFAQAPALFPASSASSTNGLPLSMAPFSQATMFNDLEVDASLEYTGIAPEEVLRYISEQDATTQKWTCLYQDCGKLFGRRENIRSHVQTHLGDRQYRCNGCGKCFVRQHDLKRHAKIHSGNKPYKCPCGAGFARQDALTRHRQRGMCVGGFPDAVRRQAKRGRPRKNRPNDEERMEKSARTRRALASAPSSSASSPADSDGRSPSPFDGYEADQSQDLPQLLGESQSFNDGMSPSTHSFG
jgi:regulatory protein SWI5